MEKLFHTFPIDVMEKDLYCCPNNIHSVNDLFGKKYKLQGITNLCFIKVLSFTVVTSLANSVTHQAQRHSRSLVCFEILYACTHALIHIC